MNEQHEVAMLAAQMWGEANAQEAEPEQFGVAVAQAYCGADYAMSMECITDAESGDALVDILSKRAK